MKKFMSVLLALLLVLAMVPVAASAEGTNERTETSIVSLETSDGAVTYYETLGEAVAAVHKLTGEARMAENVITLLKDASGGGVAVGYASITEEGATSGNEPVNITFDLGGFSYTVTNPTVGSAGTETNGFQLLKDSTVRFVNGTLTSSLTNIIIQNYSNLTVENVDITATNASYVMSNNCGEVNISGDTSITAGEGKTAFDVCVTNNYPEGVTVNVNTTGTITGKIEYGIWGQKPSENKTSLNIQNGKFDGEFSITEGLQEDAKQNFRITGGDFLEFTTNLEDFIPDGMKKDENGQIVIDTDTAIAEVNGVGYTTLQAAIDAAKDGDTVEVYAGTHDGSIVIDGKDITLEGPADGKAVITISADTASKIASQNVIAGETTPYSGIVAVKDATVTLENLTIQGNAEAVSTVTALTHNNRYAGLVALDADVTVENCDIKDITYTNGPAGLQGMQNGFGIYAVASSSKTLTLTNVNITNFNKAAAVIRSNVDLTMTGGSVTGYGAQAVISQNGIQYAGDATISGTTFSGLQYTAENEWKGGSVAIYNVGTETESTIENVTTTEVDYSVSTSAPTSITGGTYAGTIYGEGVEGEDSVLSISGGTYPDCDVTEYLEEGLEQNENGTVVKDTPSTPGGGTPSEPEEPTWPFEDVTEGDDWFYDAVAYVYENGIMAGTDETTFEPYMELDRAMAAQLFYNLEGKPTVTGDSTFTDVTSGHWAVDAITWAAQNDIVAGIGGGLYDPDSNVTREQFAVMLYKYARFKGYDLTATGDLTRFPDAGSISSWAETALSWANGNGLINGHENGAIDPKGSTIRAQAASIMANFDQNVAK